MIGFAEQAVAVDDDADGRVARVVGAIGAVLVQIHSNPRTQDSREPFDLNDLWLILAEENEEAESW